MDSPAAHPNDQGALISVTRWEDIRAWCERLGCTAAELGNAVGQVGHSAERVRAFLARGTEQGAGPWPPTRRSERPD
jgi:uncharacterized protein DUF3606